MWGESELQGGLFVEEYENILWQNGAWRVINSGARDRAAAGHGIYLVFWFGVDYRKAPKPPNNIKLPTSAAEMEEEIRKTVPSEIEDKIEIIVFDCSRPNISKKLKRT